MKKIIIILMILASMLLFSDKVYAEGVTSIHDLSVTIELNDDNDSINVRETFKIKNITPDTHYKKVIDNGKHVYSLDSNYYPTYLSSLSKDEEGITFLAGGEETEKDYYLNYSIKNKTIKKGEKYTFKYTPPVLEYTEPVYDNIHIVIRSTEENPVSLKTIKVNDPQGTLKVEEDGNIITITGDGTIKNSFSFSFDKVSHSNSIGEIYDIANTIMTLILIAMITLTAMKAITGNSAISNVILIVALAGASLFLGATVYNLVANSENGMGIAGIFPLAFCTILYGLFYGALFFSKKTINQNKLADASQAANLISMVFFTFAKIFVCFHSFFMISTFTGPSMGTFNLSDNRLLFFLILSLFIGSYGYQYFDRDISDKKFDNIKF